MFEAAGVANGNGVARQIWDLTVTNKAKEIVIERFQAEREAFVEKLENRSRKIGELETRLLQLEAPNEKRRPIEGNIRNVSED